MPQAPEFSLTVEDAKKLFEEKLESLRGQVGALERELGRHQIEVDRRREDIGKLDVEIESKQKKMEQLANKVASGEAAREESSQRIMKSLDDREAKANARIDKAEASEREAQQAHQHATQRYTAAKAAKADVLASLSKFEHSLVDLRKKVEEDLASVV